MNKMQTTKIKQLTNSVWVVKFYDLHTDKVYVRFVSNTVVQEWESTITIADLKEKVSKKFGESSVRMWEKDDQKRVYVNVGKNGKMFYDFNTSQTGGNSSLLVRTMADWCKNGLVA